MQITALGKDIFLANILILFKRITIFVGLIPILYELPTNIQIC